MRLVAALPALALIGATPTTQPDYGAAPSWDQAITAGEAAVKDRLIDPDSALIEWPYQFSAGSLKPLFGKAHVGYWTCGYVNAKSRMGGYSGRTPFLIMIRDGRVTSFNMGESDSVGVASVQCHDAIKAGQLKPVALRQAETATIPAPGPLGFVFQPTPYGALIATVAPGSAAEKAGLKPGEVIEAVNGIPIKGMAPADMIKVVVAPSAATFDVIGAGEIKVR